MTAYQRHVPRRGLQEAVTFLDKDYENKSPYAHVNIIYWTGNIYFGAYDSRDKTFGDGCISSTKVKTALLQQTFDYPLVQKSSDWLVAVERAEISMHGIPMITLYPWDTMWIDTGVATTEDNYWESRIEIATDETTQRSLFVAVTNRATATKWGAFGGVTDLQGYREFFDLHTFIHFINSKLSALNGGYRFFEDEWGYMNLSWTGWNAGLGALWGSNGTLAALQARLYMTPNIKAILGTYNWGNYAHYYTGNAYRSQYPRTDLKDTLSHIRIETNLSVTSDNLGSQTGSTLTDFSVYQSQTRSIESLGLSGLGASVEIPVRQKIVYIPAYPRYSLMSDSAPILYIRVSAKAVDRNGDEEEIRMPVGSSMNIKLSFTKRVAY